MDLHEFKWCLFCRVSKSKNIFKQLQIFIIISIYRVKIAIVLPFSIFYIIYMSRKCIQNYLDKKKFQKTSRFALINHQVKENSEDKNSSKIFFNNQPFNPEVCNVKIFFIVATLFTFIVILGTFIALKVESKFYIFQMFGRFLFSVVIPLIVYIYNSDLGTFVLEMFH